ncbi:hypothetical protein Y032_0035g3113 [Ancylostoma ceylanicum]|nr:hypothetical protein Y032_0035g3113 [Ancylostoma ceylanicum]
MNVAKEVGKAMNEQQQPAPQPTAPPASSQQLSQDDIAKITAGLGTLGALLKDKAGDIFQKPAAEKVHFKKIDDFRDCRIAAGAGGEIRRQRTSNERVN